MRIRNIFIGILAVSGILFSGCQDDNRIQGEPDLKLTPSEINFESTDADTQTITLSSTREWKVLPETLPEWIGISPASGNAEPDGTPVEVTVTANDGADRTASVTFTIGTIRKTLSVSQKGPGGSAEELIVYHNDFDKEAAVNNSGWPLLDNTEAWKNAKGSGISSVGYAFSGMSVRNGKGVANSAADGGASMYAGSGSNNLFFAKGNYFQVKNITLDPSVKNYVLSFGAVRSVFNAEAGGSIFDVNQFSAYVSNDGAKWVKLGYDFASGSAQDAKWDKASSVFTLPDNTSSLYLYFTTTEASTYRIDDLDLSVSSKAGSAVDFSKGVELDGGSTGGEVVGTPEGDGTEASPYNVAAAKDRAMKLPADTPSEEVYIKGIISKISEVSTSFGNATYSISDDGTSAGEFIVFRGYWLNGDKFTSEDQIKVGNKVVVFGKLVNYKGDTPEVNQGNRLISVDDMTGDDFKSFSVSKTDINVSADSESATFKVNGNVAWTASVTEGDFVKILSGASGNGAGDVVLELTKNVSEESARTAKITVTTTEEVATKSYVVTLTQAKKTAEGSLKPFTSNVEWTLGDKSYSEKASINGESDIPVLKLGTSKLVGNATITIPAGTKKVGFYGVSWKGKKASVSCSVGGQTLGSQEVKSNDGAANNQPYTMTVTEADYYEITVPIELTADTDVKIESVQGDDYRVILFGINAYK